MLLGIDHLVVAVEDPDAAAAELEHVAGLRSAGGGRHDRLGTFNRLVWLGDSYLELIGVFDEALAETSWIGGPALRTLATGGGLVTWAIATDSIDHATAAWYTLVPDFGGPADGERAREDGRSVRWRLAAPGPLGPSEPPFLIEHDTTAAEWTAADRSARATERHPIGRPRLAGITLRVANRHALAVRVATLLGVEFASVGGALETRFGSQTVRLEEPRTGPGQHRGPDATAVVRLLADAISAPRAVEALGMRFELVPGRT